MNWDEFFVRVALGSVILGGVSGFVGSKIYAGAQFSRRSLWLIGTLTTAVSMIVMASSALPLIATILVSSIVSPLGGWLFVHAPSAQDKLRNRLDR